MQSGGMKLYKSAPETIKKMAKTVTGRKFTEEHKKKIGLAQLGEKNHMYGKHLPNKAKQRIKEANIKVPSSGAFPSRKISQYDLNGNFIKTWNSMGEIYRCLGLKHCGISNCCRGKQRTCGGYIWKYLL